VTLEEFVRYVLQQADRGLHNLDMHWMPQYNLCASCKIKYDFIGHHETLHHDAEHVLRQISRYSNNTDVRFPASDINSPKRNSREFVQKFYGEVSASNVRRLLQLYKKDYDVFGYKVPDIDQRNLNTQANVSSSLNHNV